MAGERTPGYQCEDVDLETLEASGLTMFQIARRLQRMVALLHEQGYESLYLYCGMAPHGFSWRFDLSAMDGGIWPRPSHGELHERGWVGDGRGQLTFARLEDEVDVMAARFSEARGDILEAARIPNAAHVAWYREMLARTEPLGLLLFWYEYQVDQFPSASQPGPNPTDLRLSMPPGYRDRNGVVHR